VVICILPRIPPPIRAVKAADIMCRRPTSVHPDAPLRKALQFMEDRPSQISSLPVIDDDARCLGLIRIHDIYSGGSLRGP
jgi:arabinose-5-phosphate isomerase